MFLLVPAHPGSPGTKGRKTVVVVVCVVMYTEMTTSHGSRMTMQVNGEGQNLTPASLPRSHLLTNHHQNLQR